MPPPASLLQRADWASPDPAEYPTGTSLVEGYLQPLAALPEISRSLRLGSRVVAVTRSGRDRRAKGDRGAAPLVLVTQSTAGRDRIPVRAVIDASGTWGQPNPLGADGLPADGEREAAALIDYGIPDPLGGDRLRYAGRRIAVVGSGHSAQTVVRDLAHLSDELPGTSITWVIRGEDVPVRGAGTALPERDRLVASTRAAVDRGRVQLAAGFRICGVTVAGSAATLVAGDGRVLGPFDRVVAATGARPDLGMVSELQVDIDPVLECPRRIAPLIDPALHSCDTVPVLAAGYRQVASVVAHLAGVEVPPAEPIGAACSPAEAVGCGPVTAGSGCCARVETAGQVAAS